MIVTFKLLALWWVILNCVSKIASRRVKRVMGGLGPLPSHNLYSTQFVVSILDTFECVSDQTTHIFEDCQHQQSCTGSLVRPDFVLTACHCMVYEDYYVGQYATWYPFIMPRNPTRDEFPTYLVDRLNYRTIARFKTYKEKVVVKHAVLNAMTVMAGDPHRLGKQRRHAAKFFPHHLCSSRHRRMNPAGFVIDTPEGPAEDRDDFDIGLIRTCYPFKINRDVQLAPMKPYDHMDDHLNRMLSLNMVCLMVGWGETFVLNADGSQNMDLPTRNPDIFNHGFRYLECADECGYDGLYCSVCTRNHGSKKTSSGLGDSGGPLICERFLTAILKTGAYGVDGTNETTTTNTAVACIKEFLTDKYFAWFRRTSNEQFHYLNGKPVRVSPANYPEDLNPIIFPDEG